MLFSKWLRSRIHFGATMQSKTEPVKRIFFDPKRSQQQRKKIVSRTCRNYDPYTDWEVGCEVLIKLFKAAIIVMTIPNRDTMHGLKVAIVVAEETGLPLMYVSQIMSDFNGRGIELIEDINDRKVSLLIREQRTCYELEYETTIPPSRMK